MSTDRLSGIAMLGAHKDMPVDTEADVNDFVGRSRHLVFLFNNLIITGKALKKQTCDFSILCQCMILIQLFSLPYILLLDN